MAGTRVGAAQVLSPFMGGVIDKLGGRGYLAWTCAVMTVPVFCLLAFTTNVTPFVPVIWLGIVYSVAAASLWPSVPLLVDPATVGTAMGVMTSVQMIGIGICNIAVGLLRGTATQLT